MSGDVVIGIARVKDEADIIEATVRHMAAQVDGLLVADNGSTDGTLEILQGLTKDLHLVVYLDDEVAYLQAEKMTTLAQRAPFEFGPVDWVVPFDADEIWYSGFGTVAEVLETTESGLMVAMAEVYDHVATGLDNPDELDPTRRIVWRRNVALPLGKAACRWRPDLHIHQGNHFADYGGIRPAYETKLVVRHFPYRSPAQLVRKVRNGAAAYRAAGDLLPESMGAHWRQWGDLLDQQGEQAIHDLFYAWYWSENPAEDRAYIYDPAPVSR